MTTSQNMMTTSLQYDDTLQGNGHPLEVDDLFLHDNDDILRGNDSDL